MELAQVTTGSGVPKLLGCYEQELHSLIGSWSGYDRGINIGCGALSEGRLRDQRWLWLPATVR
jgi:hypothetical protein